MVQQSSPLIGSSTHICSSHCSLRYQRTVVQIGTEKPAATETRLQASFFAPTLSSTTREYLYQHLWRKLMGEEEEEVDTLEQFRRVILTGWHGNIARETVQKLRENDSLIALDPFKLKMVGSLFWRIDTTG